MSLYQDFKPSILFLGKFVGLYLLLNVAYGFYLNAYDTEADPMTRVVTYQAADIIDLYESKIETGPKEDLKSIYIFHEGNAILSVYEGCNGLNVMIIFLSFMVAYNRPKKAWLWFIPLGLIIVHFANLLRIILLYHVTISFPDALYFTHKYLFTAFIFLAVIALWAFWILKIDGKKTD